MFGFVTVSTSPPHPPPPQVMESGVLGNLSDEEKKLQEAMFEVIMSEATYLRSLDVLIEHFMDDPGMNPNLPEGRRVMLKREHHVIFSNIRDVRQASARWAWPMWQVAWSYWAFFRICFLKKWLFHINVLVSIIHVCVSLVI